MSRDGILALETTSTWYLVAAGNYQIAVIHWHSIEIDKIVRLGIFIQNSKVCLLFT